MRGGVTENAKAVQIRLSATLTNSSDPVLRTVPKGTQVVLEEALQSAEDFLKDVDAALEDVTTLEGLEENDDGDGAFEIPIPFVNGEFSTQVSNAKTSATRFVMDMMMTQGVVSRARVGECYANTCGTRITFVSPRAVRRRVIVRAFALLRGVRNFGQVYNPDKKNTLVRRNRNGRTYVVFVPFKSEYVNEL